MYAITGITGQVGGAVARTLLADGANVRAVARDTRKAAPWVERGCELAIAEMSDAPALARGFAGADGVFVLIPPIFDPSPGFAEAGAVISAVRDSLAQTRPARTVCLSTVGAQTKQPNLLHQLPMMERAGHAGSADRVRPRGLVYGECNLGCPVCARGRRNPELPATARPRDPDGRYGRYRRHDGAAIAGAVGGPPRRRAARPGAGVAKRVGRRFRPAARPLSNGARGAAGRMGGAVPYAGHAEPDATHANARWLQSGLAFVRGW
jgi:uncharacterized protein YbjT (DUF2867 family)